jgi:protein CLEC16A
LIGCTHFDITQDDDELIDYYVSFLKSLTLKLNEETVNFFFNDKFKTFPLYHQAIKFYNHRETMVRTSVRTITLTIYSIKNPKMKELFVGLPYCSYFACIACQLRDIWALIDALVASPNIDSKQLDKLLSYTEDANETLFYI